MKSFSDVEMAPADPIFGLNVAFQSDQRPNKVNLGVGVYRDGDLKTPLLHSVQEAEERLAKEHQARSYLPIDGDRRYAEALTSLVFGPALEKKVYCAQTPGGTAALRVAGDFLFQVLHHTTIHLPTPTWENHRNVFVSSGLQIAAYSYYDHRAHELLMEPLLADLEKIPMGECVLFHASCQNPTGVDPTPEQWKKIAQVVKVRNLLPLFDCAYQGFGEGLEEDVAAMRLFAKEGIPLLAAYSCSKNFGLYAERVGALFAFFPQEEALKRLGSQMCRLIRSNYSNPPCHGAWVVQAILGDAKLRLEWEQELTKMRQRIHQMRHALMESLMGKGKKGFAFLQRQKGLFSFSGLEQPQVERLKSEYGVYMTNSGRINVAGLNEKNLEYVVGAICAVL
ncbi:MAG: aspartate/tyrosine/aromatic aminotransferase [Verrucomicrobia bacterium]|nr:aspartate/tyrosine/aromatic aminotransferase [Verrucomicrobiota bacterium]